MSRPELIGSGVIYRNTNPGYEYSFACHSHLVQLSDRELLCAYQRGQALYAVDCVCAQSRSIDGGKTWVEEPLMHNSSMDDKAYSYHGPFLTYLGGQSVIAIVMRIDRSNPKQPLFNEKTGGIFETDTLLLRSGDGGKTWSRPEIIHFPNGLILTPSCPIVVLRDGRWFLSTDQWHGYDDPGPYKPRTVGLFSSDQGKSWKDPVTFGVGESQGKGHWHGRIVRLRDDRLFTLFWTAELSPGKNLTLHQCIGTPDGREWTQPTPTNIPGQTNWPVDLGNGKMAAIYTVRETKPPGFFVTTSDDGGKTWDIDRQLHVWDATDRDKIGISDLESYPRSHDTIAYGAPSAAVLSNGDIFLNFWCTEVSVTQIRYARLRISQAMTRSWRGLPARAEISRYDGERLGR